MVPVCEEEDDVEYIAPSLDEFRSLREFNGEIRPAIIEKKDGFYLANRQEKFSILSKRG
jgi:hypothetical protein